MKTKQILTLGVILLVLVIAVITKEMKQPSELATQEYVSLDISFDNEKIEAIDISRVKAVGSDEEYFVQMVKKEGVWKIGTFYNARADEKKIEAFLDEIKNAKGELRASSKEVFEDFGITDETSYRIVLFGANGKDLLKLRVGTVKNRGRAIFVRYEGEENVFMTDADIFGKVGIYGDPADSDLGNEFWADVRLASYETSDATRIESKEFKDGAEIITTSVAKENGEWQFTREGLPFEISGQKVTQFLDSLKGWRAQKVVDPEAEDYGFETPSWQMSIAFEENEHILIKAGKMNEDAKAYYIYVSSEPVPFQLTHYYFENMSIDDSRFFENNPLGANTSQLEALTVATKSNRYEFTPATKTWPQLTEYINTLSNFRVGRLIFDSTEEQFVKSPSKQFIEIKLADAETPLTVDIGKIISEESREHAVTVRGSEISFVLKESDISRYFEGFDKILEGEPADPAPEIPAEEE